MRQLSCPQGVLFAWGERVASYFGTCLTVPLKGGGLGFFIPYCHEQVLKRLALFCNDDVLDVELGGAVPVDRDLHMSVKLLLSLRVVVCGHLVASIVHSD